MKNSDKKHTKSHHRKTEPLKVMPSYKQYLKNIINHILSIFGYEINKKNLKAAEGYPSYLEQANKVGMDVNDWIEQNLGWGAALPMLEQTVFPYLKEDSVICELGVGTGRWSRHLAKKIPRGELHLVDHSRWLVRFLEKYFSQTPNVHVHLCNSISLPFSKDSWIDFIFSEGTFIELKLGYFLLYAQEFFRVLKPGGHCIISYNDICTAEGWGHFHLETQKHFLGYTYHTQETIDRLYRSIGFEIGQRYKTDWHTLLVLKKPAIEDTNFGANDLNVY